MYIITVSCISDSYRSSPGAPVNAIGLVKYNLHTGESWQYVYGTDIFGGELCFVPNEQQESEVCLAHALILITNRMMVICLAILQMNVSWKAL